MSGYSYEGSDLLLFGEHLRNYNAAIADLVARECPSPNARTLDFGAGFGTLTRDVAKRIGRPDCVEPDARQRAALEAAGFVCMRDAADLTEAAYDYVYSSNVLEHIEDDVDALRALHRSLRPGATIVLYLPAFSALYSDVDRAVGHYRRYDAAMIRQKLRAAGFSVRRTRYADPLGFPVSLIFKHACNRVGGLNPRTIRLYDNVIFPLSRALERALPLLPFGKNIVAVATRIDAPTSYP